MGIQRGLAHDPLLAIKVGLGRRQAQAQHHLLVLLPGLHLSDSATHRDAKHIIMGMIRAETWQSRPKERFAVHVRNSRLKGHTLYRV